MKLYLISLKVLFVAIFCTTTCTIFANNVDNYGRKEKKIKNKLNGGVNFSLFEHYWESPESILKTDVVAKIREIHQTGFTAIRLPVAFDLFLQRNSSNVQIELLDKLGEAYNTCHELQMQLIITYHYGKLTDDNRWNERDKILWIWKQMQAKFNGMGYDDLFFELYNEPTMDATYWKESITYIVNGLRYEDKNRFYIVGGTNYNNADELPKLGKIDDEKIFYTFHFYEPYLFTHQGADWTKDKSYITGIPYPYKRRKMPKMPAEAAGTLVEENYLQYQIEGTYDYIDIHLRKVLAACKRKKMPIICTETGVIGSVPLNYRNNYLYDVTKIMSKLDIPVLLWDYEQKFAVIEAPFEPLSGIKKWLRKSK